MEFVSEKVKQGGPPELRALRRGFGGGVGGVKSGEAREVSVEPGFERMYGGEGRGRRNGVVLM